MINNKKAFTLVELIVVITILAILGTIAFLSYLGYARSSRDSVRVADFGKLQISLELFKTSVGYYPDPTPGVQVSYSGAEIWTQGTISDSIITNLQKINKKPVDPLTGSEYAYSRLNTKKEFEIASIFEGDMLASNTDIIPQAYVQDNLLSYVKGTYNGVLAKVNTGSLTYVLSVPTIIGSELGNADIIEIIKNKLLAYKGFSNLPASYKGLGYTMTGGFDFSLGNPVVFSGSIADLENIDKLKDLTVRLQDSYIGSVLENVGMPSDILSIDPENDGEVSSYMGNFVNNFLGGKIKIIPKTGDDVTDKSGKFTYPYGSWTTYTTDNGLPDNNISSMITDKDGNIWLGGWDTCGGVSKFDGTTWTNYNTSNSDIVDDCISSIFQDKSGNIWIGGDNNGGVSNFDGTTWTTFTPDNSGIAGRYISSIKQDKDGSMWFASWRDGISKFDGTNWTTYTTTNSDLVNSNIVTMITDKDGNIWLGGRGDCRGISKFDGTTWTNYTTDDGLADDCVSTLFQDNSGKIWVGGDSGLGLSVFNGTNGTNEIIYTTGDGLVNNNMYSIREDKDGNIWAASGNNGVNEFDGTNWISYSTSNSGIYSNYMSRINVDNDGNIWFGSDGVSVYGKSKTLTNGLCGADNGKNVYFTPTKLCSIGSPVSIVDAEVGGTYTWTCNGLYGGSSVNCSANHVAITLTQEEADELNTLTGNNYTIEQRLNVTDLNLYGMGLTSIPTGVFDLINLTYLDLGSNQIETMPADFGNLTNLDELYLSYNAITTLPSEFWNLTNLKYFYTGGNQISTISSSIGNLTKLIDLGLDNNLLTSIPQEIGNLPNLKYLYLNNNYDLASLPLTFGNLVKLRELDLGNDSSLGNLSHFFDYGSSPSTEGTITISGDGSKIVIVIDTTPRAGVCGGDNGNNVYFTPTNLCTTGSPTTVVDANIGGTYTWSCEGLNGGANTNCSANRVAITLTQAEADELNNLTGDSKTIEEWVNSTYLNLNGMGLTSIPTGVFDLIYLTGLNLGNNELTILSSDIGNLRNLEELYLQENQLTVLPPEIGDLTKLTDLNLYYNSLTSLPQEIGNLTKLGYLDMEDNWGLGDLSAYYNVDSNPHTNWNITISGNGSKIVINIDTSPLSGVCGSDNGENVYYAPTNLCTIGNSVSFVNAGVGGTYTWTCTGLYTGANVDCSANHIAITLTQGEADELNTLTGNNKTIQQWLGTTYLDLYDMGLTSIPTGVFDLTRLTGLDLGVNQLVTLPSTIGNLTKLEELYLGYNNIGTTLPSEIGNLTNLQYLYLNNNNLSTLPSSIGNLISLLDLNLMNNHLTAVPSTIGNLTNLQYLSFNGSTNLTVLPSEIGNLINLLELRIIDNNLTTIPSTIGNLVNLQYLYITYNPNLTTIPSTIGNLISLQRLYLDFVPLTSIPTTIGNLTNLEILDLYNNNLYTIPSEIGNLTNLTYLRFDFNHLTTLPASIGNLTRLDTFSVYYNNLSTLPSEIGNLTSLRNLTLTYNHLTTLPSSIGNLTNLVRLFSYNNDFTSLPSTISNLINLKYLRLRNNAGLGNLSYDFDLNTSSRTQGNMTILGNGSNIVIDVANVDCSYTHIERPDGGLDMIGDTYETATILYPSCGDVIGNIDIDRFKITLNAGDYITLYAASQVVQQYPTQHFSLYSDSDLISPLQDSRAQSFGYSADYTGTYYIRVDQGDTSSTDYKLSVTVE